MGEDNDYGEMRLTIPRPLHPPETLSLLAPIQLKER
jgi:hypothetical protein